MSTVEAVPSRLEILVNERFAQAEPDRSNGWAMRLDGVSASYLIRRRSTFRRELSRVAIEDITLPIEERKITALIGPSGCGKSTLLRCLNRLHDREPGNKITGKMSMKFGDGEQDILSDDIDPTLLRRHVGMILQQPRVFDRSIRDNVLAGLNLTGNGKDAKEISERLLEKVGLLDEVKDKLDKPHGAVSLSGGQQQRLCIARALAVNPKVLLMDEPCSSLDPISTSKIEDLMKDLTENDGLTIVTHNLAQAARVADNVAFLDTDRKGGPGKLVEYDTTSKIFTNPRDKRTEAYIKLG